MSKASNKAFTVLPQRHMNSPALCHIFVHRDPYHLSLSQDITLLHHFGDTVLIGLSEQEVATTPVSVVRRLHSKGYEINMAMILGPSTSVKFIGI